MGHDYARRNTRIQKRWLLTASSVHERCTGRPSAAIRQMAAETVLGWVPRLGLLVRFGEYVHLVLGVLPIDAVYAVDG